MPPKKTVSVETPDVDAPSSSEALVDEKDAAALRKIAAHPPTAVMVREALTELDSRKGVSSKAIQNYIVQKYSVDSVRLRPLVRKALKKGIENGTLVRPAYTSATTTGASGKFRLPPKAKEAKPKSENADPNAQKAPKAAKNADKKPPKSGTTKASAKSQEDPKPPKKLKKAAEAAPAEAAPTKAAPAKKPKAKKAAEKEDDKEEADAPKKKGAKATKDTKAGKASKSKAAKADAAKADAAEADATKADAPEAPEAPAAPAPRATGKRGRKAAEKTAE